MPHHDAVTYFNFLLIFMVLKRLIHSLQLRSNFHIITFLQDRNKHIFAINIHNPNINNILLQAFVQKEISWCMNGKLIRFTPIIISS